MSNLRTIRYTYERGQVHELRISNKHNRFREYFRIMVCEKSRRSSLFGGRCIVADSTPIVSFQIYCDVRMQFLLPMFVSRVKVGSTPQTLVVSFVSISSKIMTSLFLSVTT